MGKSIQEAPVEGAWGLCKMIRNQQAVREFKEKKKHKAELETERLQQAYRSGIADKILEMEDKSYAMKLQAKRLEQVFRWEALVGRVLTVKASCRVGLMQEFSAD